MGFSVDGLVILGFGLIVGLIGTTRLTGTPFPPLLQRSPIVLGGVGLIIGIYDYNQLSRWAESLPQAASASIGYGLWITLVGSGAAAAFGLVDLVAGWSSRPHGRDSPLATPGTAGEDLLAIAQALLGVGGIAALGVIAYEAYQHIRAFHTYVDQSRADWPVLVGDVKSAFSDITSGFGGVLSLVLLGLVAGIITVWLRRRHPLAGSNDR